MDFFLRLRNTYIDLYLSPFLPILTTDGTENSTALIVHCANQLELELVFLRSPTLPSILLEPQQA